MQVFASKKVYMFFYGVIGIINVRQFNISACKTSLNFPKIHRSQDQTIPSLTLLQPGNAIHLPLNHVVNSREEVWYKVKRDGEDTSFFSLPAVFCLLGDLMISRHPWSSSLKAYLMSGNEIAQILFLFFLPITVKVWKACFLPDVCKHFSIICFLQLFLQAKKRPLWCGIGLAITRYFFH